MKRAYLEWATKQEQAAMRFGPRTKVKDLGSTVQVIVSPDDVQAFARIWPASGLQGAGAIQFEFEKSNGDLVDVIGDPPESEGSGAVSALATDAQNFAADKLGIDSIRRPLR